MGGAGVAAAGTGGDRLETHGAPVSARSGGAAPGGRGGVGAARAVPWKWPGCVGPRRPPGPGLPGAGEAPRCRAVPRAAPAAAVPRWG